MYPRAVRAAVRTADARCVRVHAERTATMRQILGGTTCLTLLVYYDLVCCVFRCVKDHHTLLYDSPVLRKSYVTQVV